MTYERLDIVIKEYCASVRDHGLGRYGLALIHAVKFLDTVYDARVRVADGGVRIPVVDRWARFPERMSVSDVCVEVNGNMVPLLPNHAMADPRDGCGTPDSALTGSVGNPDWPAVNIGTSDVRIGTGGYWPGQGGGKSDRGYYRIFNREHLILLDATCRHKTIIAKGLFPTFSPGEDTWVPVIAKEAIAAFIDKEISPTNLSLARWVRCSNNLKAAMNAMTSADVMASWRSRDGVVGR